MAENSDSDPVLRLSVNVLAGEARGLRRLVEGQAGDEALWFSPSSAHAAHLQHELRRLHGEVERVTRWVDDTAGPAMPETGG